MRFWYSNFWKSPYRGRGVSPLPHPPFAPSHRTPIILPPPPPQSWKQIDTYGPHDLLYRASTDCTCMYNMSPNSHPHYTCRDGICPVVRQVRDGRNSHPPSKNKRRRRRVTTVTDIHPNPQCGASSDRATTTCYEGSKFLSCKNHPLRLSVWSVVKG